MNTPLLLIAWRRPHTLRQVIDAIRPVAPKRLYVACDGPNHERPGEAEKVAASRAVIELEIDWPCQIERLYSDVNQGCRLGVSRAITWFFEQVEEGIILEDDCVPHPDFFGYCTSVLTRYRYNSRVWGVCGSNFQNGLKWGKGSYYFSTYPDPWGWATWRRCWKHYHDTSASWDLFKSSGCFARSFTSLEEASFWEGILDDFIHAGRPDTWDYQWFLTSWMNNGLHAWPNSSLVQNVGYGLHASHTFGENPFETDTLLGMPLVQHPLFIAPCHEADHNAFITRFSHHQPVSLPSATKTSAIFHRLKHLVLRSIAKF